MQTDDRILSPSEEALLRKLQKQNSTPNLKRESDEERWRAGRNRPDNPATGLGMTWAAFWDDPELWTPEEYHEYFTSRRPGGSTVPNEPIEARLSRMGVPPRYINERIIDWKPDNGSPRLRVAAWIDQWQPDPCFLTLEGNKGQGKTMLAAGVLRYALQRWRVQGMFVVVPELIDRYRRTQSRDRAVETPEDIDDILRRVPLLVMDDLGVGRQTDFADERLYLVINRRYNEMKPTVITTNVALTELEERIRSRILSGTHVQFKGEDRRLAG